MPTSNSQTVANSKREFTSTPGWIRTTDLRIRSPLLYPAELRARVGVILRLQAFRSIHVQQIR